MKGPRGDALSLPPRLRARIYIRMGIRTWARGSDAKDAPRGGRSAAGPSSGPGAAASTKVFAVRDRMIDVC